MKKKVVILRNQLLPYSETFILEQTKYLKGWEPTLVGLQKLENGLDISNVDYEIIPNLRDNLFQKLTSKLKNILSYHNKSISKHLKKMNPDVIHIHFGVDAVYQWESIKNLGIPIIITLHGYDINIYKEWWESGAGGHFMKKYPAKLLEISRHSQVTFIAVSQAIKNRAIEFGIPKEKIIQHYIGVDTEKFNSLASSVKTKENIVLFVGRFVEKKAPLLLIKAFSKVVKEIPDAMLVMVGDGELKEEAERLVNELGLPVEFRGVLSHDDVIQEFDKAKVFCLPSVRAENGDAEGLPIAILEAIFKNLFIVVTSHSGNTELPEFNKYGKFVLENNIISLSENLISILRLTHKENIFQVNKFVNSFTLNQCNARLENIYDEVTNATKN